MAEDMQLIIGVDGGGTTATGLAMNTNGQIMAMRKGQGINYNNIGLPKARQHLRLLVDQLLKDCGQNDYALLSLGMSALDGPASQAETGLFAGDLFDKNKLLMDSDAHIALYTAVMDGPGMMVICGTGSMVALRNAEGFEVVKGGWGYLLGDPLSAFNLAADGMRAAIGWWERQEGSKVMADAVATFFNLSSPRHLIDMLYDSTKEPQHLAGLAQTVLALARDGDQTARAILERNIQQMAQTILSFERAHIPHTIWVYGGMFSHNPTVVQALEAALCQGGLAVRVQVLPHSPAFGALSLGLKHLCLLNQLTGKTMHTSYQEVCK